MKKKYLKTTMFCWGGVRARNWAPLMSAERSHSGQCSQSELMRSHSLPHSDWSTKPDTGLWLVHCCMCTLAPACDAPPRLSCWVGECLLLTERLALPGWEAAQQVILSAAPAAAMAFWPSTAGRAWATDGWLGLVTRLRSWWEKPRKLTNQLPQQQHRSSCDQKWLSTVENS